MRNLVISRILSSKPQILKLGFDYPTIGGTKEELEKASDEEILDFLEVITNFLQENITYKEIAIQNGSNRVANETIKTLLEQTN